MKTIRNIMAWIALWAIMVVPCFARGMEGVIKPDGRNTISSLIEKQNGNIKTTAPLRVHPQGIRRLPKTTFAYRGVYTKKGFVLTSIWPAKSVREMDLKIAQQQNAKKSKTLLAKGKKKKPSLVSNRGAGKAPIIQNSKPEPQPIQPPKEVDKNPVPIPSPPKAEVVEDEGAKAPIVSSAVVSETAEGSAAMEALVNPKPDLTEAKSTVPQQVFAKKNPDDIIAIDQPPVVDEAKPEFDYGPGLFQQNLKQPSKQIAEGKTELGNKETVVTEINPQTPLQIHKKLPTPQTFIGYATGILLVLGLLAIVLIVRRKDFKRAYYRMKRSYPGLGVNTERELPQKH